jgi:hypothetical protein
LAVNQEKGPPECGPFPVVIAAAAQIGAIVMKS